MGVEGVASPLNTQGTQASFCGDSMARAEEHVFAEVSEISVAESKPQELVAGAPSSSTGVGVGVGSHVPWTWAHGGVRCFRTH